MERLLRIFTPSRNTLLALVFLSSLPWMVGCVFFRGQQYHHFTTPTPLPEGHTLILGFLGGRDSWNDSKRSVRKLALKLRSMNLPNVQIETVENKERELAIRLIRNALDRNQNGALEEHEKTSARLILYGQSFGGAAVVKAARELSQMDVPVLLTMQVDSVGRNDAQIPSNVGCAANLFQKDGILIHGEPEIEAENPARTYIIGNFRYDYKNKQFDLSQFSWWKKVFRVAHLKMEVDPAVWAKVEEMVVGAVRGGSCENL
ncbi:MAG: hypothetical protein HY313_06015 [Acidobacteria bacterium]|nr:hypothetical protein [Acidobacteriota bacterium]